MFSSNQKSVFAFIKSVCPNCFFIPDGSVNCNRRLSFAELSQLQQLITNANIDRCNLPKMTITTIVKTKQTRVSFEF